VVKAWSKPRSNPYGIEHSPELFAAFFKIHLNTPKSPNIKVVQFFERHKFAFGRHCRFGVENGEKLGQLQILTFIGAMKNQDFARRSCSNH
jgi:hypothetical protein